MKLSEKERQAHREAFRSMGPAAKLDHIFTYFRLPILLSLVAVVILISVVHRQLTKKEPLLYCAWINTAVGTQLEEQLNAGCLDALGKDPKTAEIAFYRDLYLSESPTSENHEFAYASRMKLMAATDAEQLDLVLMNREAYDILSASGYLLELSGIFGGNTTIHPFLTANTVVLEDNSIEHHLNEAEQYLAVTEEAVNAIDASRLPMFAQAGFDDTVYLGIIGNTPRLSDCVKYVEYLASE